LHHSKSKIICYNTLMSILNRDLNTIATKVVTLLVVTIYLFVPVYLFWHMEHMADDHMIPTQDCSYITGHNSICPMDISGHLSIWQQTSVIVPTLKFTMPYLNALSISLICLSLLVIQLVFYLQRQRYRSIRILFTSLFSQGILNGKAY
jgi:hypothetical protein